MPSSSHRPVSEPTRKTLRALAASTPTAQLLLQPLRRHAGRAGRLGQRRERRRASQPHSGTRAAPALIRHTLIITQQLTAPG